MGAKGKEDSSFTVVDKRKRAEEETPSADEAQADAGGNPQPSSAAAKAPPIDFSTFIISLSSSAVYHMGGFQDPYSGKTSMNLDLAKQSIDMIAMLEVKTKGNLDPEEQKLITHVLYDLRMRYVELVDSSAGTPPTP
ncbi:MAG: DUF1844 domain-containing protein [Nitrospinae bacterium]|nr:DUF1844 domain-containing protein [Nitrospinota bacterium]